MPIPSQSANVIDRNAADDGSRLSRRAAIAGLGFAAALFAAGASSSSIFATSDREKSDPDDAQSEPGYAGVALLEGWMAGDIASFPTADPSWQILISQISNFVVNAPPDWSFTETFSQTPRGFDYGYTTTSRAADPNEAAAFIVFDFFLFNDVMAMDRYIELTVADLAGNEPFDLLSERSWSLMADDDARFTGFQTGDRIVTMQTYGSSFSDRTAGIASSTYSTTIQIAPIDQFDELAADVFLPMLNTFQRFSGGSGDETPTPSPTP